MSGMGKKVMNKALSEAVAAYKRGLPVVVRCEKGGVLHGEEFLQNIVATGISMKAFVVNDVPLERWNRSDWPEILAAAHNAFFLKRTG
jgi:hypothetical protein